MTIKCSLTILALLALAGCSTVPERTPVTSSTFRSDTLYFENNAKGQKAAQEVLTVFQRRQKVVVVDQKLPRASYPVPLSRQLPQYPYDMRQQKREGTVLVDFIVDETGRVIDAVVVARTNKGFNAEALKAVRSWTFVPAKRDGICVRSDLGVPIMFSLPH